MDADVRLLAGRSRLASADLVLAGLFRDSRLQSGTKLEIRITAPNRVGEALLYTMRTATVPRAATLVYRLAHVAGRLSSR